MGLTEREEQEKARDQKAEAVIMDKKTGRIVKRKTLYYDDALKWAKFHIGNGSRYKYKVYRIN